jgi:hypothetical protein
MGNRDIMKACVDVSSRFKNATSMIWFMAVSRLKISKTNSVAFSPKANYTEWATATGWRILVPTYVDRELSRGQRGGTPTAVNLSFLGRSRYFFFKVAPHLSSRVWDVLVPDPLLLRKSGSAGNRTRELWVCSQELWPLDHRGGQFLHYMVSYNRMICGTGRILWGAVGT